MICGEAEGKERLEKKRVEAEQMAVKSINARNEKEGYRWAGVASGIQTAISILWGE